MQVHLLLIPPSLSLSFVCIKWEFSLRMCACMYLWDNKTVINRENGQSDWFQYTQQSERERKIVEILRVITDINHRISIELDWMYALHHYNAAILYTCVCSQVYAKRLESEFCWNCGCTISIIITKERVFESLCLYFSCVYIYINLYVNVWYVKFHAINLIALYQEQKHWQFKAKNKKRREWVSGGIWWWRRREEFIIQSLYSFTLFGKRERERERLMLNHNNVCMWNIVLQRNCDTYQVAIYVIIYCES